MKETGYRDRWNLENLYPDGSGSDQFGKLLKHLDTKILDLEEKMKIFQSEISIKNIFKVEGLVEDINDIRMNLSQASSFITCLIAQNTKDSYAFTLRGNLSSIDSRFDSVLKKIKKNLAEINQELWEDVLEVEGLIRYKFLLDEWRTAGKTYLSEKKESIISDLMADGYHAWGHLYNSFISSIRLTINVDGEAKELSFGQAFNLRSHPEQTIRKAAHIALENEWGENEEIFAKILNHIAGFRLETYKQRGITNVLEEPLRENRLKEETLNAMWSVVGKNKLPFINYLNAKAKLMGNKEMYSYNFWAPVHKNVQRIPFDEGVDFILDHFGQFGMELERFTKQAFNQGWVEAEDRIDKSGVAFCARFPLSGESRIFMNYGERITNVLTMAHELGHAFHNHAMKQECSINTYYPLSIAETASTFSEMIILDAAVEKAESDLEKMYLLDEKLKRSVMNFMNIHSRFLFEKRFYEERKEGFVPAFRLNHLMQEAVDEAYQGSLHDASVHSWVWTPHYYITKSPFYNFPYTFGYLFSISIYAEAKKKGKVFERHYIDLLRDSGKMSTEDLVKKHLGQDITSEAFWENGIKLCVQDVEEFIRLASEHCR